MRRIALMLLLAASLNAAAQPTSQPGRIFATRDVIEAAAAAEGEPIHATIEIVVQATGSEHGVLFLNSEKDYRDPRNITVELWPSSIAELQQRFGEKLPEAMIGQRIRVAGYARRVTIWFYCQGMRTDKYYYQTHLPVADGQQVHRVL